MFEESVLLPSRAYGEGVRQKLLKQDAEVSQFVDGVGVQKRFKNYANTCLGYKYSGYLVFGGMIRAEMIGNGGNAVAYAYIIITRLPHLVSEQWNDWPTNLPDYITGCVCSTNAVAWTMVSGWQNETQILHNWSTLVYMNLWFGGAKQALGVPDFIARGRNIKGTLRITTAFDP